MAKQNVTLSDTFNIWRQKTNTIGAGLGDIGTLTETATITYTGVYGATDQWAGTTLAEFTISITAGVIAVDAITEAGDGYAQNDKILIKGSLVGGIDDTHDIQLNVDTEVAAGVTAVSIDSGVTIPDMTAEVTKLIAESAIYDTFTGYGTALTTSSPHLAGAVNEHDAELGTITAGAMGTTASTVSGAIAEHEGQLGDLTLTGLSATDLSAAARELRTELGDHSALTTTTTTSAVAAINELHSDVGDLSLNTTATDLTAAVNEHESDIWGGGGIDARLDTAESTLSTAVTDVGNLTTYTGYNTALTTAATSLAGAVNEHETDLFGGGGIDDRLDTLETAIDWGAAPADGSFTEQFYGSGWNGTSQLEFLTGYDTTAGNFVVDQVYRIKTVGTTDFTLIGAANNNIGTVFTATGVGAGTGTATTRYFSNAVSAFNYLIANLAVAEGNFDTLVLKSGDTMTGNLALDGVTLHSTDTNNLILQTYNAANALTDRLNIADSTGNIGIAKAPHATYKFDVSGDVNATNVREAGTLLSSKYVTIGAANTITGDKTHTGAVTLSPGAGKSVTIGGSVVASDTLTYLEWLQDTIGDMFDGSESGGITATYNDGTGNIDLVIGDNGHNHTTGNITGLDEHISDTVGAMVSGNTETGGISVTYQDADNTLDFVIADNGHNHTTGNVTGLQEYIQDQVGGWITGTGITVNYDDGANTLNLAIQDDNHNHVTGNIDGLAEYISDTVGAMVTGNTESGISVTYDDGDNTLDFNVNDPLITISGDVAGSATMTNLGNVTISTAMSTQTFQDKLNTALVTNGSHTGIAVTYDDGGDGFDLSLTADPSITLTGDVTGSGTMTNLTSVAFATTVVNDSHSHTTGTLTGIQEYVEDTVGAMVTGNVESGIAVSYDDGTGKLNFDVNDPTIQLSGDVTGSAVMTNLGSIDIVCSTAASVLEVYDVAGTKIFPV